MPTKFHIIDWIGVAITPTLITIPTPSLIPILNQNLENFKSNEENSIIHDRTGEPPTISHLFSCSIFGFKPLSFLYFQVQPVPRKYDANDLLSKNRKLSIPAKTAMLTQCKVAKIK